MALLVIAFLITSQRAHLTPLTTTRVDTSAAQSRATVMNSYIDSFETQAANSLAVAGFFTLQNQSAQIRTTRTFVQNLNATVGFCMNNRTAPHNCLNSTYTINATLNQLTSLASDNLGINTVYFIQRIWITEERPFEVVFWMNISYNVSDSFASWSVEDKTISAIVDVTGMDDPLYSYLNASNISRLRTFNETSIRPRQFTNTTFYAYYTNRSYIANTGNNTPGEFIHGPSVLQRFTGNFTNGSVCCGIESVVHISDLNSSTFNDPRRVNWSFIDYHFVVKESIPAFDCSRNQNGKFANNALPFSHHRVRMDGWHFANLYYNVSNNVNYSCATN